MWRLTNQNFWLDGGHHFWYLATLLLKVRFDWYTSSWTCRTTPHPWSRYPPGQFFGQDESRGSFWATFTISTLIPDHSFMLKSYRVVGWWGGGVVVAHVILVSAQVLLVLILVLWTLGLRTRAWQLEPFFLFISVWTLVMFFFLSVEHIVTLHSTARCRKLVSI